MSISVPQRLYWLSEVYSVKKSPRRNSTSIYHLQNTNLKLLTRIADTHLITYLTKIESFPPLRTTSGQHSTILIFHEW